MRIWSPSRWRRLSSLDRACGDLDLRDDEKCRQVGGIFAQQIEQFAGCCERDARFEAAEIVFARGQARALSRLPHEPQEGVPNRRARSIQGIFEIFGGGKQRHVHAFGFRTGGRKCFQTSSEVKARVGAMRRTTALAMRYMAVCAERRPRLLGAKVYRRSLRTSK